MGQRDERRVDAGGDTRGAVGLRDAVAQGEQLDGAASGAGCLDVLRGDAADALGVDVLAGDAGVEGQGCQDRGLGGGVVTVDVRGRVGLGVAQLGGLGEHLVIAGPTLVHGVEDVVGGAVDDAHDGLNLVASQGAQQRADDRDGRGDGGLEEEVSAGGFGSLRKLTGVGSDEGLVRSDHGLAGLQGRVDDLAWVVDPADDFDDQVDVLALRQGERIVSQQLGVNPLARAGQIGDRDAADLQGPADTGRELVGTLVEQSVNLSTDCAHTQQCNTNSGVESFTRADGGRRCISHEYSPNVVVSFALAVSGVGVPF